MMTMLSRRTFLQRAPIAAAAIASTSTTACAQVVGAAAQAPTTEELEHYYSFLWCEFRRLSEEMGVDMCDAWTAHKSGGYDAYQARYAGKPATSRAKVILRTLGGDL